MAQPFTIHSAYAGMARDYARDELPAATVWNLVDYIPNLLGAPLRKRGGTTQASSAISAATYLKRVMYGLMDSGGAKLLAIDSVTSTSAGAGLWSVDETTGAVTFIGSVTAASAGTATGAATVGDPVYFGKQWFIPIGYTDSFVSSGAITATSNMSCTVYNGSTLSKATTISSNAASGGATGARYCTVFKNRVLLANTPYSPRRIWFNIAGDRKATKFTDNHAWMDMPVHITGLQGLSNALVVFGSERAYRVRGSVPPPGSDFVVDELSDQGCIDSRSISTWDGKCVYANTNGVFLTDAIQTIDLTQYAGMSNYYRGLLTSYTNGWRLRGQVFRGYYFLTIADATDTFVDCLVCDLRQRSFFRFSNFNFHDFAVGTGTAFQKFYGANAGTNRVLSVTDIFNPSSSNKNDADGTAVLPVVEFPCRRGYLHQMRRWIQTSGITHWLGLYFNYDLRDAASDNPTLQASYVTTPESTSYTNLARTLTASTVFTRQRLSFGPSGERGGKMALALGVKITQTAASSDTRLYNLEAEYSAVEGSRLS